LLWQWFMLQQCLMTLNTEWRNNSIQCWEKLLKWSQRSIDSCRNRFLIIHQ
jgi:hypothetical protein